MVKPAGITIYLDLGVISIVYGEPCRYWLMVVTSSYIYVLGKFWFENQSQMTDTFLRTEEWVVHRLPTWDQQTLDFAGFFYVKMNHFLAHLIISARVVDSKVLRMAIQFAYFLMIKRQNGVTYFFSPNEQSILDSWNRFSPILSYIHTG